MKKSIHIGQLLFFILIICFSLIGFSSCAGTSKTQSVNPDSPGVKLKPITLPKPQTNGGKPLMQALMKRQTTRSFSTKKLPEQVLSNLLWAAFGINRPGTGKRTAPSAVNWQEIDIYVALEKGLYLYEPNKHILIPMIAQDFRAKTTQMFQPSKKSVENAPVTFIYIADFKRIDGIGRLMKDKDKALTAYAATGFIGQNVYLFCASEGLGTVVRAMIDKPALREEMNLRPNQRITLCQTIGYRK
ncbi:MAG: SagB/ThcOx family dehydrogenase [Deltaproteobacteria bacterium]|nr:SagB/ThcOx family dehydrogenase [Deltaproteobacteria bacterium]MBW1847307.1 SagB/ThcOx family dehydrogenase [Deltaproteobacteria bacterium]MBW1983362.1 SagB/ThcOx family dehydrogenase [Deltaproteobacteria bacterium]MBW2180083.1 SagB/ThcOx family dehydrogenase [Deltaproteobacteria bacterium]MBW2364717.1 SagB/ThcOx family dehydrogenase [Deltaproteobacteria bacterium]